MYDILGIKLIYNVLNYGTLRIKYDILCIMNHTECHLSS